ncbi:phosphoethanolamine transferase [Mitsuokella multacida]|uniref:phosphoethanolamine transferase n=1 Tax=Mitsuokella multacida TaxID=52226 RepID=UPI0026593482|nr:phosphoethanolamine transferase [Mitsuokella multacida]
MLLALFVGSACHAWADPEDSVEKLPRNLSVGRLAANLKQSYDENRSTAYIDYALASQPVEILEDRHDIPKVIFILGESTSRHHMQLYGYDLPTTPNLSRREQVGGLTAFSSVTSPHAGTMAVMRTLFSFYDNDAAGMWYDYGNIFDILREAGVHTSWLSNQESSGFYGSIGRTLASRCDEQAFTSHLAHTIDLSERYDEEVLPLLDDALAGDGRADVEPQSDFIVVHLMGAHEDFKRRYPASFARFTAADETGGVRDDAAARQIRAEYDNAVLYDDHIVDAIIRRVEDQDALVIFLSDHGEEVNDVRDLVGHGDESSAWQRDIPMVIWTSAKFRANHPGDVQRISAAKDHAWQSDEMIHTLLDIMKIRVPQYEKEKSLLLD